MSEEIKPFAQLERLDPGNNLVNGEEPLYLLSFTIDNNHLFSVYTSDPQASFVATIGSKAYAVKAHGMDRPCTILSEDRSVPA